MRTWTKIIAALLALLTGGSAMAFGHRCRCCGGGGEPPCISCPCCQDPRVIASAPEFSSSGPNAARFQWSATSERSTYSTVTGVLQTWRRVTGGGSDDAVGASCVYMETAIEGVETTSGGATNTANGSIEFGPSLSTDIPNIYPPVPAGLFSELYIAMGLGSIRGFYRDGVSWWQSGAVIGGVTNPNSTSGTSSNGQDRLDWSVDGSVSASAGVVTSVQASGSSTKTRIFNNIVFERAIFSIQASLISPALRRCPGAAALRTVTLPSRRDVAAVAAARGAAGAGRRSGAGGCGCGQRTS